MSIAFGLGHREEVPVAPTTSVPRRQRSQEGDVRGTEVSLREYVCIQNCERTPERVRLSNDQWDSRREKTKSAGHVRPGTMGLRLTIA